MRKGVFTLEPLSCPSCIKKIERALGKMEGIQEVKVLFNSSKVRTQFNEDQVTSDEIQQTISKLGNPVVSQKVS